MINKSELLLSVREYHLNKTIINVVNALVALKEHLSSDDSGLVNIWEEVCVQVQGDRFSDWIVYEETIERYIDAELSNLPAVIEQLICYIGDVYPASIDDVFNQLKDSVMRRADRYSNKRIEAYLER